MSEPVRDLMAALEESLAHVKEKTQDARTSESLTPGTLGLALTDDATPLGPEGRATEGADSAD